MCIFFLDTKSYWVHEAKEFLLYDILFLFHISSTWIVLGSDIPNGFPHLIYLEDI